MTDEHGEIQPVCPHGRRLWWNYGDGAPRHFDEGGTQPEQTRCAATEFARNEVSHDC